ncbi:HPP family protein [Haloparvum sedimenti]|uniref:HPP family protein n=1 Tax=Haloparvum sedimenti TaxID=1678448 RepID=UPI00071E7587|nr:HPP family protein [Haloparvum sedimenti]
MVRRRVYTSLYASLLFTVLGLVAWATGQAFVFPSLGPSAYLLAFDRRADRARSYRVVWSHFIGAAAGLLAYSLIAEGVALTASTPPFSPAGLRLAASGVVSIALTSWAMIATDANHAPACATTLIVSLGLLSTPRAAAVIVAAVVLLVAIHHAVVAAAGTIRTRLE